MNPRKHFLASSLAALFIISSAPVFADYSFVNYQDPYFNHPHFNPPYFQPNFEDPNYYGEVIRTPEGYQIIITPPDAILYQGARYPDEQRFERRQQQWFHPGYRSWREYYDSPPWHQQYDLRRNFHPYWMR